MANEVTINIESSLAAMAFVLADQQDLIKTLRETSAEWEKMYKEANFMCDKRQEDISLLENEIKECKDNLSTCENKMEEQAKDYEALYEANIDMCKQVNGLKDKMLKWTPYISKYIGLAADDCATQPCILVKTEVIKEGLYYNGEPIPVGTEEIMSAWLSTDNGQFYIDWGDGFRTILAWCIVGDKNFMSNDTDTTDQERDV